jgi:hypothetical protein
MSWVFIAVLSAGGIIAAAMLVLAGLTWRQWSQEDDVVQMPGGETIFDPQARQSERYPSDPAPRLMITDLDIYRAANLVIDPYGDDALTEAARRGEPQRGVGARRAFIRRASRSEDGHLLSGGRTRSMTPSRYSRSG